jgi:hypothetical protein
MSLLGWIIVLAVVVFVVSVVVLLIGRAMPRKDDPEFAESATHAREGRDPGFD